MKTFKQFISEMPRSVHTDPSDIDSKMLDDEDTKDPGRYDRDEVVGQHGNYNIHARSWKSEKTTDKHPPHMYIAQHDDTDLHHMTSRGGTTKDNYFIAYDTKKHPDYEMSAPDFYHEIIHAKVHAGIQSGEEQTEGGKSIWKRLHDNYPDVHVTHHDAETGKEIKLHTGDDWDKNYDQTTKTHLRAKLKNGIN